MEPIDINKVGQKLAAMDLAFELDGLEVHVNWFRAYESTAVPLDRWHYHSDMELHFMLEGSANFAFEKDLLTLRKGECVLIPAKYPHRLWGDTEHFSVRYVLALSLDYAGDDEEFSTTMCRIPTTRWATSSWTTVRPSSAMFCRCWFPRICGNGKLPGMCWTGARSARRRWASSTRPLSLTARTFFFSAARRSAARAISMTRTIRPSISLKTSDNMHCKMLAGE